MPDFYRPRHQENTPFRRCPNDYWEEFQRGCEVLFETVYGPLRAAVTRAVGRVPKCCLLHFGFARLRRQGRGRRRYPVYSCRTRRFGPCCAAKCVAAFTERVVSQVPEPICRWPLIFTIPKVLQMLVGEHRLSPEFAVRLDNSLVAPGVCTLLHLYGRRRAPAQLRVAAPAVQP